MWDEGFGRKLGEDYVEELAELGAAELEKRISERPILADGRILSESRLHNASQLKKSPAGLLSFRDLRLLDGLFKDGEPLRFPNRIEIDPVAYYEDHMEVLAQFDSEYRSMSHARIHLPPGAPVFHL